MPGKENKEDKEMTEEEKERARESLEKEKQFKEDELTRIRNFLHFINTRKNFFVSTKSDDYSDKESVDVKLQLKNFKSIIRDLISFYDKQNLSKMKGKEKKLEDFPKSEAQEVLSYV